MCLELLSLARIDSEFFFQGQRKTRKLSPRDLLVKSIVGTSVWTQKTRDLIVASDSLAWVWFVRRRPEFHLHVSVCLPQFESAKRTSTFESVPLIHTKMRQLLLQATANLLKKNRNDDKTYGRNDRRADQERLWLQQRPGMAMREPSVNSLLWGSSGIK